MIKAVPLRIRSGKQTADCLEAPTACTRLPRTETSEIDTREYRLFQSLDIDGDGYITVKSVREALSSAGLDETDSRLAESMRRLSRYSDAEEISFADFSEAVRPNILHFVAAEPSPQERTGLQRKSAAICFCFLLHR